MTTLTMSDGWGTGSMAISRSPNFGNFIQPKMTEDEVHAMVSYRFLSAVLHGPEPCGLIKCFPGIP